MSEKAPKLPAHAPSGFFAMRTPLLAFDVLERWGAGLEAQSADAASIEDAAARDRVKLAARLRAIVADDPRVREALFVASPSLDDAITAWLADPASARARGVDEILTRYLGRMAARATPFGLFSGCSVGKVAEGGPTKLEVAPGVRRHTRLDTHYLSALCEALMSDPAVRAKLPLRPSTGLATLADQLRYAEVRTEAKTRDRSFFLVSVDRTAYLDATLARAKDGATMEELAQALVTTVEDATIEDARGFVEELVQGQILVSDLSPIVTGPEPIDEIIRRLEAHGIDAGATLAKVARELRAMDESGLGLEPARYRSVADALHALPAETELPRLFQVDLFRAAPEATLGDAVMKELARGLEVLARLRPPRSNESPMQRFRTAFSERYERNEIPLAEVLDDERGIGFGGGISTAAEPAPLLHDLRIPAGPAEGAPYSARDAYLARKIDDVVRSGRTEWVIEEADLAALGGKDTSLPADAFCSMASVRARDAEALAAGDFTIVMQHAGGPSGANLLGRFCHGDPELSARVQEHLRAEEALRPEAIFAEIVHLPEGRLGNILCRPLLRRHEISFLGRSGATSEDTILASDLRVSVQEGRVVVRSERLGREIVPRMTTAHNHSMAALGTYRFLCALQADEGRGLGWSWGVLTTAPFTPRVRYGKLVLEPAHWTITKDEIKAIAQPTPGARILAVRTMRARRGLPRWIGVADGDNVLPVDLENSFSVDSFVALVKKRDAASLVEWMPEPEELCARGPGGRLVHEIVVPYVAEKTARPAIIPSPSAQAGAVARTFVPGSEWLYAKIYAGTATSDRVLREVVTPWVEESLASGDADSWFFIRYSDPGWHLRVRLHGEPAKLLSSALPRLHAMLAPFLADRRASKLVLDTYEREVERYGGDRGMIACEGIFRADSDAALAVVAASTGDEGQEARWRLALRGMHVILVELGLDLAARHRLMVPIRDSFAREHNADTELERQLGARFRAERASLDPLIHADDASFAETPLGPGIAALAARTQAMAPYAAELRALAAKGELHDPIDGVAGALLHMHANRVLRSEQRAQELVLYDLLARLYESDLARAKAAAKRP